MQVMNGAEFKQAQVIIGQQTKTRGFSVSDDPMLMSILSTGLYQNPLKSMIQEAVFNAWDAHKAAGQTDKAVEIVFTDDNQLIISDSGLGIAPEDMYEIYCVYGASTKRDDNDQTGGFGLGCKAPFAYTDSFRVTSSHKGKRYLYLVSRANDDNDGKPGITELVGNLDCVNSGLIVSIPLKDDRDALRAYEILKDKIFPYSGIKWSLQFKDHDLETGSEEELAPGQFVLGPGQMNQHTGLTAQYGGVAYAVPYDDECGYQDEYNFLANTIGAVGSVRAGFDSGTLTPLPSREGLNLSENTVKNLRVQIQNIIDELNILIHPMMELAINWVAHCVGDTCEELYDAKGDRGYHHRTPFDKYREAGISSDFSDVISGEHQQMFIDQPIDEDQNAELVMRLREVIMKHTRKMVKGVGIDWFLRRRAIAWSMQNDHNRQRFDMLKEATKRESLIEIYDQKTIEKTIFNLLAVSRLVGINPHLRTRVRGENQSSRWTPVAEETEPMSYLRSEAHRKRKKAGLHKATQRIRMDALRAFQGSRSAPNSLNPDQIVLAHTIKDANHADEAENSYNRRDRKMPIIVIGTSVKKLETAKEFLEGQGYEVLVAPKYVEPEVRSEDYQVASASVFEGWPVLDAHQKGFACSYRTEKEPTMYILYSKTRFKEDNDYSYYRRNSKNRFDHNAVRAISRFFSDDRIVVINHPNKVRAVKKLGIQSLGERVDEMVRKMFADASFASKLSMHQYAEENGNVPDVLLQIPEFSKILGLPYIRTHELIKFRQAKELLENLSNCTSDVLCSEDTRALIKKNMAVDPAAVSRTTSLLTALNVLDAHVLKDRINRMGEGERKVYAEKLARFVRTTAT